MKVYIAGPITGKLFYQDKFQKAAELLKKAENYKISIKNAEDKNADL